MGRTPNKRDAFNAKLEGIRREIDLSEYLYNQQLTDYFREIVELVSLLSSSVSFKEED